MRRGGTRRKGKVVGEYEGVCGVWPFISVRVRKG